MEVVIAFLVASAAACAPVAFVRLAFRSSTEPWWYVPLALLLMAVILVFLGGVNLAAGISFPPAGVQILTTLIIAWGGWVLLALRRG